MKGFLDKKKGRKKEGDSLIHFNDALEDRNLIQIFNNLINDI